MTAPVRLRDAYRFFLPLVLMTELNMISKSVIHAFLARSATPSATLAAFNTSFTFYYTLASGTEVSTLLCISYLRDRACVRRVFGFFAMMLAPPLTLALGVAFTPAGDWLYGTVFGASDTAVREAKLATAVLTLSAPVLVVRGMAFSLLMVNRKTIYITFSTMVRLLALGVSLVLAPRLFPGAVAGAAALVTCMASEGCFAWLLARRFLRELPARAGPLPRYRELWRFSWPLWLNNSAELGVVFVVNLFLGRLARPDVALAAFGVAHGLVGILMSPMRNLAQTGQTLVATREDLRVLLRFTFQLVAAFAVLAAVLFHTSGSHAVLGGIVGLTPELEAYAEPAMRLCFVMSVFWALSALFRGLTARTRDTGILAATGGLRIATAAVIGAFTLVAPEVNGALLGLVAWIAAYAVEVTTLGLRLRRRPLPSRAEIAE